MSCCLPPRDVPFPAPLVYFRPFGSARFLFKLFSGGGACVVFAYLVVRCHWFDRFDCIGLDWIGLIGGVGGNGCCLLLC